MTTTVINMRDTAAVAAAKADGTFLYVGRAVPRRGLMRSPWGNPFHIGADGARDEVLDRYRLWLRDQPHLDVRELIGRTLACWCAPQVCHADVLAELAEAGDER